MKTFKIGVISDTHYPSFKSKPPFEKIREHFSGSDIIIHAGDLVSLNVIDMLENISKVEAVCGNMDLPEVIAKLPKTKILNLNGVSIGIIHGFGPPFGFPKKLLPFFKEKINILIFGHTHKAFNKVVNGILCFNPGSPAMNIFNDQPTLGLITFSSIDDIKAKVLFL
ncbi:MAG: metallophosphatase family protein [Elusimicrobia bacterium]|nr:metallophosphatase family protein [Candidatus Liberimonas magnetica]